ncbi:MAG: hypothetical protein R2800_10090 [Flavipsychrobacter sp.]
MKQSARELLVTTKVAQNWQEDFDKNVDELMEIVARVDNDDYLSNATELLDVYHNTTKESQNAAKKKKMVQNHRPFEFLVFRN